MSNEPRKLGETLENYFKNLGAPPVRVVKNLADDWENLVGPALAEHTRPGSVVNEVLEIVCDGPVWINQVKWSEAQIVEAYNERYEPAKVTKTSAVLER